MKLVRCLIPVAVAVAAQAADRKSPSADVEAVFADLRHLKSMGSRDHYTLPAHGENLSGSSDDFLRRRTPEEIRASGLSCGCGDYAAVFFQEITARGYDALLVDSAQLSFISLYGTNAGHAVVAIRPHDAAEAPWWLVDSTALRIISRQWSPDAKSFTASGNVYWIGYCGPLDKYAVRGPEELKDFYRRTLATVPVEVLNRTLVRFVYKIDDSLRDEKGALLNPRVERMAPEQERIFAKYRIAPEREVAILLTRGGDDASGYLDWIDDQWVARVGLKSACSASFMSFMEQRVRSRQK